MSSSEFSPGVLVDFDGTIVDSLAPLQESFYRFLSRQGIEAPDIRFEDVMPLPIADVVRLLRDRYGWTSHTDHLLAEYLNHSRAAVINSIPMPDAVCFLRGCQQLGAPVCIVTSGEESGVWHWLERLELSDFVKSVVGSAAVTKPKPHPQSYLIASTRIGRPISHCIAVEDSIVGALSACQAGAKTYVVGSASVSGTIHVASLNDVYSEVERQCAPS